MSRTPASMPEAPLPCNPAGFDPSSNHPGDMNNPSQINPLACAGAGEAAGHDAAACVSACSECAGASVSDARDASELSPTTLPVQVRLVVAPQPHPSHSPAGCDASRPTPRRSKAARARPYATLARRARLRVGGRSGGASRARTRLVLASSRPSGPPAVARRRLVPQAGARVRVHPAGRGQMRRQVQPVDAAQESRSRASLHS